MRIIAFYSPKGGVGKTAAAVNMAYLASRENISTLLWDLDPQGSLGSLTQKMLKSPVFT